MSIPPLASSCISVPDPAIFICTETSGCAPWKAASHPGIVVEAIVSRVPMVSRLAGWSAAV